MKLICTVLLFALALACAATAAESVHPYPLFPCKPVPGRPGFGTPEVQARLDQIEAARKEGGEAAAAAKVRELLGSEAVLWGYPEFQNYPGSKEHIRHGFQRYLPPYPRYNAKTLVKNIVLNAHAQTRAACVDFAEPVYWHAQWNRRILTSAKRALGKLYPWKPGAKVDFEIGTLEPRMMYAVRVVGVLPSSDVADVAASGGGAPNKQLVFKLTVNDGPGGATNSYVLRACAGDNLYETVVFLFHCVDGRAFRATLELLPESETTLYVHNVDVHNIFGECARRAGKTRPTLFSPANRLRVREETAELVRQGGDALGKKVRDWVTRNAITNVFDPRRRLPELAPEARIARDDALWHTFPPINTHFDNRKGGWVQHGWQGRHNRDYASAFGFRRGGESYTRADLAAHRELPGTGDRGWGVVLEEPRERRRVVSFIAYQAFTRYQNVGRMLNRLVEAYHVTGDGGSARDAAMLLAALAYQYPAVKPDNGLAVADGGSPESPPRRYAPGSDIPGGWGPFTPDALARYYDTLFDFIDGNEALAAAVGRYIPWVKTPDDLRWLFDVYVLQYAANEMLHYRYYYDHGLANLVITNAVIQDDSAITKPWMDFIWTRCWEYPQAVAGLADNVVTNTTRDGTTNIGSWSYTNHGNAGLTAARNIGLYLNRGGLKTYDLTDFREYPKSLAGVYFFFESLAAGGIYPGIGDVGGPSRPFMAKYDGWRGQIATGWRATKDPRFAWFLTRIGRTTQSDAEWALIERAAAGVRNPAMAMRSRVLSEWSGYLETGLQHDDFRFRRAAALRVGNGVGHSHRDALDLRLWALGCTMAGDFGQRGSYGRPRHFTSYVHNVVEVDGDGAMMDRNSGNWDGYAWIPNLFDAPGARYMAGQSTAPANHRNVSLFRRQIALIDVDEGRASAAAEPRKDANVTLPQSYVFDVFRVAGGKRHTYCFHGCVDTGFEVNVKDRVLLDENGESADAKYMQRFRWARVGEAKTRKPVPDIDKQWAADPASDVLQATWTLGRGAETRMVTSAGAMTAPTKYMRMHLMDAGGLRVLHGICADMQGRNRLNPDVPHYAGRCLYAQKRSETPIESAFVALLEPYEGEPFIASRRRVPVEANETDARRAVALEVKTTNGRTDLLFADGRPTRIRSIQNPQSKIQNVRVSAEYAFASYDTAGLRQAVLSAGTLLQLPELAITAETSAYRARVREIDYLGRTALVDAFPARFARDVVEVGNDAHRTTYELSDVRPEGAARSRLVLRKGLEIMRSRVTERDSKTGFVKTQIAMIHKPGRDDGLVASNEDLSAFWRARFVRSNRHEGHDFILSPMRPDGSVAKAPGYTDADFPLGAVLRIWEFGVGDEVVRRTGVSLKRVEGAKDTYAVFANVPFVLKPTKGSVHGSRDGKAWRPLADGRIGEDLLAGFVRLVP